MPLLHRMVCHEFHINSTTFAADFAAFKVNFSLADQADISNHYNQFLHMNTRSITVIYNLIVPPPNGAPAPPLYTLVGFGEPVRMNSDVRIRG